MPLGPEDCTCCSSPRISANTKSWKVYAALRAGAECFELDLGPWSVLGNRALSVDDYVPDFDAVAQPPCRMIRIRRAAYRAALEACILDPVLGYQVRSQRVQKWLGKSACVQVDIWHCLLCNEAHFISSHLATVLSLN